MLEHCWIRWDSAAFKHVIQDYLVSKGATQSYVVCCQCGTCLWFHGKVSSGEWDGSRDLMTSNGGSSPSDDKVLA
jgi:hypothetical protein